MRISSVYCERQKLQPIVFQVCVPKIPDCYAEIFNGKHRNMAENENTVYQLAHRKHGTVQIKDFTYVLKYLKGGKGPKMCKIIQTQRKCFITEHVDELCQNTFTHR